MAPALPSGAEYSVVRVWLPGSRAFWLTYSFGLWVPGLLSKMDRRYRQMIAEPYGVRWEDIEKSLSRFAEECGAPPPTTLSMTRRQSIFHKILLATCTLSGLIALTLIFGMFVGEIEPWHPLGIGISVVSGLIGGGGIIALIRARQVIQPSVAALRSHDGRKPILLLRSFGQELATDLGLPWSPIAPKAGAWLDDWLRPYGPLIAIGRPGERFSSIGAAKLYVEHNDWQSVVGHLIEESRMVIVSVGSSKGLEWELKNIASSKQIGKVLFVFANSAITPTERERIWHALCRVLSDETSLKLVDGSSVGDAVAAHISTNGRVTLIHSTAPRIKSAMFDPITLLKGLQIALYGMFCREAQNSNVDPATGP